jgi:hypothetical protein
MTDVEPGPRPRRLAPGKVRQVQEAGAKCHVEPPDRRADAVRRQKIPGSTSSDSEENWSSEAAR